MINEQSTGTIAVSRPAKKVKDPKMVSLKARFDAVSISLAESADKIRHLEAQRDIAERKSVSDSHDTRRVANAVLTIDLLMDMAGDNKEMKANLERVDKQLKNQFIEPGKNIEHMPA